MKVIAFLWACIQYSPCFIPCNHTENSRFGLLFGNYTSTSPNLTIRGNNIGTHETGLRYTNSVNFLSQSLEGNLWTGVYSNAGAVHDGLLPFTNVYEVSSISATPLCPPSLLIGGTPYSIGAGNMNTQLWFNPIPNPDFDCSTNNIICSPAITSLTGGGNNNDYDYQLLENEIEFETYSEESEWAARRDLYSRILEDSTMLQDSLLAAFFYAYQDSSEGRFQAVSNEIAENVRFSPVVATQLETIQNQIQVNLDSLVVLDSLLQTTNDTTYLQTQRVINLHVRNLEQQYQAITQGLLALQNNTYDYIETENSLLPNQRIYEENEQKVNTILIQVMRSDSIYFSPQQVADLANIAYQCPLAGGNAVYLARSLRVFYESSTYYDDGQQCAEVGIQYRKKEEKTLNPIFEIYPNPVDEKLYNKSNNSSFAIGENQFDEYVWADYIGIS